MPDWIPRPRLPENLQSQTVNMQEHQLDPIVMGVQSLAQTLGAALQQRALAQRAPETDLRRLIADSMVHGNFDQSVGPMQPGQSRGVDAASLWAAMGGRGAMPSGVPIGRVRPAEAKGMMTLTEEMLKGNPKIAALGYGANHQIPVSVFNTLTKVDDPTKGGTLVQVTAEMKKKNPDLVLGTYIPAMAPASLADKDQAAADRKVELAEKKAEKAAEKAAGKITQVNLAARGFADRAELAEEELADIVKGGYDLSSVVTTRGEMVPNAVKSDKTQRVEQSMRNFISAVLRKESGAAIPDSELAAETKKYFPMPGDKPGVIAQKARARAQAIKNLVAEAGVAPSTRKKSDAVVSPDTASGQADIALQGDKAARLAELRAKAQAGSLKK